MRRFELHRDEDVSGISGTGVVADGVEFPGGTVVLRWRGKWPSVVIWPDIHGLRAVNLHGDRTRIVWLDA